MSKIVEDMRNETAAKVAAEVAAKTAYEKSVEFATSLLDSSLSIEDIAKHSGLPVETVKELAVKKKTQ